MDFGRVRKAFGEDFGQILDTSREPALVALRPFVGHPLLVTALPKTTYFSFLFQKKMLVLVRVDFVRVDLNCFYAIRPQKVKKQSTRTNTNPY